MHRWISGHCIYERYWDGMRFLSYALKGDFVAREKNKVRRKENRSRSWSESRPVKEMVVCAFCWRSTPRRLGDAGLSLCHFHRLSSRSPQYLRKKRLLSGKTKYGNLYYRFVEVLHRIDGSKRVLFLNREMKSIIMAFDDIKDYLLTMNCVWKSCPLFIIERLPNVYRYLSGIDADMTSSISIVTALDDPPVYKEAKEVEYKREQFYLDCQFHINHYLRHLAWAEVWLGVEDQCRHGGERKGAGRPRRCLTERAGKTLHQPQEEGDGIASLTKG
ncbi:MAG: hypothetical protein AB7E47_17460 [Desulfovibrionaceae bacterium]